MQDGAEQGRQTLCSSVAFKVEEPKRKSVFYLAKAITDVQRGSYNTVKGKCFYTVWSLFPRGSYLFVAQHWWVF